MRLEARDISFKYGKGTRQILDHVNLTVEPGESVGIMAPSGYGKTTLCKILAGYERPDSGEVLVDGMPVLELRGYCPVQDGMAASGTLGESEETVEYGSGGRRLDL